MATSNLIAQGNPFTRSCLTQAGLSDRSLRRALRTGSIRPLLRGVFVDSTVTDSTELRALAVAQVLPAGAAVVRRTAAWLFGVDALEPGRHCLPPPVECAVPVGVEPLCRPGIACYVSPLSSDDVVQVGGVPCTTPVRTSVDLLRTAAPHVGLAAADALAHLGLVGVPDLLTALGAWEGYRGVVRARRLAALVEPATESPGESWLRLRIIDAGFPRPRVQIEIRTAEGRLVYRLDMGWPDRRLAVEYDGQDHHSSQSDRAHDAARRLDLQQTYGWTVVGVGKGEVLGRSLALERGLGELMGQAQGIARRAW
jgi:hypothetical protein